MTAFQTELLSALTLFAMTAVMTAGAMWVGGRLAPWFLRERQVEAPSVAALMFAGDDEIPVRMRLTACGLAFAIMLAVLLAMVIAARLMGWNAG